MKNKEEYISQLYTDGINIKIEKPVNGFLKIFFGRRYNENKIYNTEWTNATFKLNNEGIQIKKYLIKYDFIKSVELIEPKLFSSGYIELNDYFNNYLKIKMNSSYLTIVFDILNEKIKH